jgi:hypothetical protein
MPDDRSRGSSETLKSAREKRLIRRIFLLGAGIHPDRLLAVLPITNTHNIRHKK